MGEIVDLEMQRRWGQHTKCLAFNGNPTLDDVRREHINHILEQTGGRISGRSGAAEILGMKRSSLYYSMKILGIR